MRVAAALCMLVGLSGAAFSQITPDSVARIEQASPGDSLPPVLILTQTTKVDTVAAHERPGKSPLLALSLSAVLPGAGQFYNESYWKIPIVLGFGYYFARTWIEMNDSTRHYRRLYAESVTPDAPGGNGRYLQLREFYKDQRDTFSWYIFIYYIVNLVDAYVDASLYDFDVSDDLSVRLLPQMPSPARPAVGVSVKVRF